MDSMKKNRTWILLVALLGLAACSTKASNGADRMMGSAPPQPSAEFPFESKIVTVKGYRIHYVEEGQGDPILFIHGNPTSSYLWRNILPAVARQTGRRGIALDLLGFGKSDKAKEEYTLALHEEIVQGFIDQLGLKNIVLVLHDWGGPLGAYYAVHHPENVQGIALMETFLWQMDYAEFGEYKTFFKIFRSPLGYIPLQPMNMFVNKLLAGDGVFYKDHMTKEVMAHYREPFPTAGSRRAIRMFPKLIPIEGKPKESVAFVKAIEEGLPSLKFPFLWIKAEPGAVVSKNNEGKFSRLRQTLPQMQVKEFGPGRHFLQEDNPDRIIQFLVKWIETHGLSDPLKGPEGIE